MEEYIAIIKDFFDANYYREANPGIVLPDTAPMIHYLDLGWKEGRDPSPWFSTNYYLASNADVQESGINPFVHYILYGKAEGRPCVASKPTQQTDAPAAEVAPPPVDLVALLFDEKFYRQSGYDPIDGGMSPLQHYVLNGWREGRDPCRWFSVKTYLAAYPDIVKAGVDPFRHFLDFGRFEDRLHFLASVEPVSRMAKRK